MYVIRILFLVLSLAIVAEAQHVRTKNDRPPTGRTASLNSDLIDERLPKSSDLVNGDWVYAKPVKRPCKDTHDAFMSNGWGGKDPCAYIEIIDPELGPESTVTFENWAYPVRQGEPPKVKLAEVATRLCKSYPEHCMFFWTRTQVSKRADDRK